MPYKDPDIRRQKAAERTRKYRARQKSAGITPKPLTDEQRTSAAEAQRRYREKLKSEGRKPKEYRTAEQNRERARKARAAAHAEGRKTASETWWERNREQHRENVRRWRTDNAEYAQFIGREAQHRRRSTPWGQITNRIWPILHYAVRCNSTRESYYTIALGYLWADLRAHLEAQFEPGMTWENWGDVWELDHIKPVSGFLYTSLDDPLFKQAWSLDNLRPLNREANAAKGAKTFPLPTKR